MSEPNFGPPQRNRIVINLDDDPQPRSAARAPQQVQPLPSSDAYQPRDNYRAGQFDASNYPHGPRPLDATPQPVVNPANVAPAMPRRSRAKRVLLVFGSILLISTLALGIGGALYWRSFQTTPAYSLALMADAAQRGDTATFNTLIDADKVAASFVPQVTDKLNERFGGALPPQAKLLANTLILQFLPNAKTQIREQINQRVQEIGAQVKDYPFPLVALGVRWRSSITENGDTAQANIALPNRNLELSLQRTGERWQVIGVKDEALANRIADQVMKKLPALKQNGGGGLLDQLPEDIKKRLPDLGTLQQQLPEGLKGQLPNPDDLKKQAEERLKKEVETRIKENLPPELRDKVPSLTNSNAAPPKPSAPSVAPSKPKPQPSNNVEP